MTPAKFPQRLALAGLLASLSLFGGFREEIGFDGLQSEFGVVPDGSSLKVAQIEFVRDSVWAPQAVGELTGKSITYSPSIPATFSYHGDEVGRVFYGSPSSIIPGVSQIRAFEAWNYYDYSLNTSKNIAPAIADWDVENHSYIANAGLSNNEGGRRLDFRIDRDGMTATVVLENGTGTIPPLFGNTYNTIVVGSSTGSHSRGGTTRDGNGRLKPDIVGTANYTSYAGPIVGSAAGLLIAKAKSDNSLSNAKRPEVVKALLMTGATKAEFPSWSRSATAPLDPVYGAGEVNIHNSYRILVAGRQAASPSAMRSNRGWDLNSTGAGSSLRYFFTVGAGQSGTVSAVLTWHRNVTPNNGAWNQGITVSLDNYDLRLYRATAQYQTTDLLQDSVSTVDNVEHIYLRNLTEGTYALEVSAVSGSKQFGIAWMVSGVSGDPQPPPSTVAPTITTQPAAQTVSQGASATFSVSAGGTAPFSYQWTKNGVAVAGATSSSFTIGATSLSDAGTYTVSVSNSAGNVVSASAALTVSPTPTEAADGRLGNISSRAKVETGSGILISGFVVAGSQPKTLLLRAVGPTLANFSLSGLLERPMVRVYSGETLIVEIPAGGRIPSVQVARDAATLAGAFALPDDSLDTVVVRSFAPGGYTVHVFGQDDGTGIAIVEVYDLDASSAGSRVVNLSTRSHVGRDSNILILGVSVSGNAAKQVLIRAVGPGLRQYNVDGVLGHPKVSLYQGGTLLTENVGWTTAPNVSEIPGVASRVGAFALSESSADSALLVTLAPGGYTMHVSGADGGTGVVLAEVFEVQ